MQSIGYLSLVVSGSAQTEAQERIQQAERHALVKLATSGRPSLVASFRYSIGQVIVGMGRKVAGSPRQAAKPIDVPGAFRIAR